MRAMSRWMLLASLTCIAAGAAAEVGATDLQTLRDRLEALPDDTYIGGMGPQMQEIAALGRQLAQDQLGGSLSACEPFDLRLGTLVVDGEGRDASGTAPQLPVVQALAGYLDSPRAVVRDTAAYALGEIGPAARGALAARKFDSDTWTTWQSHAGTRIRCQRLSLGNGRRVIPKARVQEWLASDANRTATPSVAALSTIVAEHALRDPELHWPEGIFIDWVDHVGEGDSVPAATMRSLGEVVADARRPSDVRRGAAYLVERWGARAAPAVPGLRKALSDADESVADASAMALLVVGGDAGVDGATWLLAHDASLVFLLKPLCALGTDSASSLSPYYVAALASANWRQAETAAETLGCVEARDAVPPLLAALDRPVWRIQAAAARSLRRLAGDQPEVRARLEALALNHWSGHVRMAASAPVPVAAGTEAEDTLRADAFNCFHRCQVDHGNHSCTGKPIRDGKYAIDGGKPFRVRWNRAHRQSPPVDFPIALSQDGREDYGTNTFLRVDGGWLYGIDRWHYDGEFAFVNDGGERHELPGAGNEPSFILELPAFGRIALGKGLFLADDAGVLSLLSTDAAGHWQADPRIALPTVPHAWAVGPNGELLVADPNNAVAIWPDGRIVSLECPR
jgi:hypothetical protein